MKSNFGIACYAIVCFVMLLSPPSHAQGQINDFESDFGFSLKDLPNLDLPLNQYEQALTEQAFLEAMSSEPANWDCETDAYTRFDF